MNEFEFEFKGWNDETTITKLYWLLACWFIHINEEIKNKRAFVWFLFNWKEYFTSQVQSFMYRIYLEQRKFGLCGTENKFECPKGFILFILSLTSNFNCLLTLPYLTSLFHSEFFRPKMCSLLNKRVDIRHLFKSGKIPDASMPFLKKIILVWFKYLNIVTFNIQNKINFIFKKFYEFKLFFMCFTSDFYEISFNVWWFTFKTKVNELHLKHLTPLSFRSSKLMKICSFYCNT